MSDHFSSSDEDLEELVELLQVPKSLDYFEEVLQTFSEHLFMSHFRLSRQVAEQLADRFGASEYYFRQEGDSPKVIPLKAITVFLWYAANEAVGFRDVSEQFNMSMSTVFKIVRRCTYFFSNLSSEILKWPNEEEKAEIEMFFRNQNFPGVIGVIDGIHVQIDKPREDPDSYLNSKQYFSIHAQIVCDHNKRIRDIFVGYPGSEQDSHVLRTSPLFTSLQTKCQDKYIIGNSGYPCLPNLLTPFRDNVHLSRRQRNYNYILLSNRYVVEHCFDLMKQKFRQLYHIKWHSIRDIVHFIRACAVLHNLSLEESIDNIDYVPNTHQQEVDVEEDETDQDSRDGLMVRNDVMNSLPLLL